MPSQSKPFDFNQLFRPEAAKVDLQLKTVEDEQEKALRLRKEFLSFLVKELAPAAMAIVFVTAIGVYCRVVLNSSKTTAEERQRAWSALSAILGASALSSGRPRSSRGRGGAIRHK